jgi:hypothetical protein
VDAVRREFHLAGMRLPSPLTVRETFLCLLMPGLSFYYGGYRFVAKCIFAACAVAALVFLVRLGHPAAEWAFMILITAHVASLSQRIQPWMARWGLIGQMFAGVALFTGVSLFVYMPARELFHSHVAVGLQTPKGVVVVNPRLRLAALKRGDAIAYRIEGSYSSGVMIHSGYGFGPVLAVPGDRVVFETNRFTVNGVPQARLANMPQSGELVLAERHLLIWPEMSINGHGMGGYVAGAMLSVAQVEQGNLAGKAFKRWFFRKQISP